MAEFYQSRLERKRDEEITKKTVFLGLITVATFLLVLIFGLPFLVKFSVLLGEAKSRVTKDQVEKILPPLPPRLIIPFEATNSSEIRVAGVAEPKTTVELLKNDVSIGKAEVDDKGEFAFPRVVLEKGDNVFAALVSKEKGGNSELSRLVNVIYDNIVPELAMVNPTEDSLKVDVAEFDVIGKSEKGVSVTVNNRLAMVDDEGNFKIRFQLNAGKNDIEIIVSDLAGNETRKKIAITYDF
jgi:bacillopeptidase F